MYIPDMQDVSTDPSVNVYAIGWLVREKEFARARSSDGFLARLTEFVDFTLKKDLAVLRTRGFHWCEFCDRRDIVSNAGLLLRSSESVYLLTNFLLPHYVRDHEYAPPVILGETLSRDFSEISSFENGIERKINDETPEGLEIEAARMKRRLDENPGLAKYF